MNQKECYDATASGYHRWGWRKWYKPTLTVKRAREIITAASASAKMDAPCKINRSLTNKQSLEILSHGTGPEEKPETLLNTLHARNIVRAFGKFLQEPPK